MSIKNIVCPHCGINRAYTGDEPPKKCLVCTKPLPDETSECSWCEESYPIDQVQNETEAGDAVCDGCAEPAV